MTFVFNSIIISNEYPMEWKRVKIIPVPKDSGKSVEYRPNAILGYLPKVFEVVANNQMKHYLDIRM